MRIAALLSVSFIVACGSSSRPPDRTTDNQTCEAKQAEAVGSLSQFIETNRACTQDSDCITVALGASCFDACTRAIAATSKDAYEASVAAVNGGACAAYRQQGCPAHVVPPCAPPSPPSCRAGVCE